MGGVPGAVVRKLVERAAGTTDEDEPAATAVWRVVGGLLVVGALMDARARSDWGSARCGDAGTDGFAEAFAGRSIPGSSCPASSSVMHAPAPEVRM